MRHIRKSTLGLGAVLAMATTVAATAGSASAATATSLTAEPAIVTVVALFPSVTPYLQLSAVLTSGGKPLAGQSVTFVAGTDTVCTAQTDAAGTASCSDIAPAVLSDGYWAMFDGNSYYGPSSSEGPLVDLNLSNLLGLRF